MMLALLGLKPAVALAQSTNQHPNILFIILDDVGIDQLKSFNPQAPQLTPVMDTLVQKGVSFNNCWMMPECSPSRACFFYRSLSVAHRGDGRAAGLQSAVVPGVAL